jgi:Uncharacterized protein predicted to be involved in DNA repair
MQLEGEFRKVYYGGFPFERRTKRPPQNPLNAILDPRIGYLHESNRGSFSLNLDIAEVFE